MATQIGLRPPLPPGKTRHEVQLDHGFRKYFNTMMRRAKVNYLDKEDMMGHKVGLEQHYERYQEEDFERFPEYQKAIPFLTISDEERLRFENQTKQEELEEIEKKNIQLEDLAKRIEELENGPKARTSQFYKDMFESEKLSKRVLNSIFHLWFELNPSEEQKRILWKKIQEAKEKGTAVDVADIEQFSRFRKKRSKIINNS